MAKKDLSQFNTTSSSIEPFNTLIPASKKKQVSIAGEYNFSNDALDVKKHDSKKKKEDTKQRGRPRVIHDKRYIVCKPKKISPALEIKLKVLEDYIHEFRDHSGRITFEMIITALADSYIEQNLSQSKKEVIQIEIDEKMNQLEE